MFIGHFGVAFAAKKLAPRASLGSLILGAQFLDFLWPVLLLFGVEHVAIVPGITKMSPFDFTDYPISHSLLMALVWSVVVGGIYYAIGRYKKGAFIVGLAVLSHWVLDFIVHRPDLPLSPGAGARFGLGLWNSWVAEIVVEVLIFIAGITLYTSTTRARDRIGIYAFWSLIALLFLGWISTLLAPPPSNVNAIAWGALTMWITVAWGWWADRHREIRP